MPKNRVHAWRPALVAAEKAKEDVIVLPI